MINFFKNIFGRKQPEFRIPERKAQQQYFWMIPSWQKGMEQATEYNYETFARETYKKIVWVYRCIREISNRMTSVPFAVYRDNSKGEKEEIPGHQLSKLMRNPNERQSWAQFLEAYVIYFLISGNAYLEKGKFKQPVELNWLRPDRIKIIPASDGRVQKYRYTVSSDNYDIPPEQLVHFCMFNPTNDYYGMSPIEACAKTIDTENYILDWNKNFFANQATPSGILSTDEKLTQDQYDRMYEEVRDNWQGIDNVHKPLVLESGLKWIQLQLAQKDTDFLNLRKLNREEICAIFGVPPVIAGILDRATYSNFEQAEQTFWYQTVIPALRNFRDRFNQTVSVQFPEGVYIDYILEHVQALQDSQESLYARAETGLKAGYMTLNESRALVGLDPVKNGDVFYMPMNVLPTSENDEPQKPSQEEPEQPRDEEPVEEPSKHIHIDFKKLEKAISRADYVQRYLKRRDKWERTNKPVVEKLLKKHYSDMAEKAKNSSHSDLSHIAKDAKNDMMKDWTVWYNAFYGAVVKDFGELTIDELKSQVQGRIEFKQFNVEDQALEKYLRSIIGQKITQVSDTTVKQVQNTILDGMKNGLTIAEISEKIMEIGEIASLLRAENIVATEICQASNAGSHFAMAQSPIAKVTKHIWSAVGDDRTRPSHNDASGQIQDFDKPFELEGGLLMFPGDSSMGCSSEEVIGCRCVEEFDSSEFFNS